MPPPAKFLDVNVTANQWKIFRNWFWRLVTCRPARPDAENDPLIEAGLNDRLNDIEAWLASDPTNWCEVPHTRDEPSEIVTHASFVNARAAWNLLIADAESVTDAATRDLATDFYNFIEGCQQLVDETPGKNKFRLEFVN